MPGGQPGGRDVLPALGSRCGTKLRPGEGRAGARRRGTCDELALRQAGEDRRAARLCQGEGDRPRNRPRLCIGATGPVGGTFAVIGGGGALAGAKGRGMVTIDVLASGAEETWKGSLTVVPPASSPSDSPACRARSGSNCCGAPTATSGPVTVTEVDNGCTVMLRVGMDLQVELHGTPPVPWSGPQSSDRSVLTAQSARSNPNTGDASGTFTALGSGTVRVTATQGPTCLRARLPCEAPSACGRSRPTLCRVSSHPP